MEERWRRKGKKRKKKRGRGERRGREWDSRASRPESLHGKSRRTQSFSKTLERMLDSLLRIFLTPTIGLDSLALWCSCPEKPPFFSIFLLLLPHLKSTTYFYCSPALFTNRVKSTGILRGGGSPFGPSKSRVVPGSISTMEAASSVLSLPLGNRPLNPWDKVNCCSWALLWV